MARKNMFLTTAVVLTLALGGVLGWVGKGMAAGEPLPGSEQDPLVSKSYVDARLEAFLSQLSVGAEMTVVELGAGQKLIAGAGTEIIVRGGSAVIIDSELGGLCDVTEGKDLRKGEPAPANHLLLVPRDDGRGIQAIGAAIVMVRGAYTVE
jgi:hypothetical protein